MAVNGTAGTRQQPGSGLLIIERILRDRDSIWRQIGEERSLGKLTMQMLGSSVLALACYGAVLGASHSPLQSVLSALKLPLLFLMTLAICLPTLYLFNLVFGAKLQVRQALALVMVTITVTAVLSLAFAPISLFFLLTAFSYSFYKILNVAILTMTAFVGLKFLTEGMHALNAHTQAAADARRLAELEEEAAASVDEDEEEEEQEAVREEVLVASNGAARPANPGPGFQGHPGQHGGPPLPLLMPDGRYAYPQPLLPRPQQHAALPPGERPTSMTLLYVWVVLFGFVGTQLAWTLRPFVGEPNEPFEIFRKIEGNFYVNIIHTIGELF